jgi:hypothetical protein
VVLAVPDAGPGAPASASLFLRDRTRAPQPLLDVPGLIRQTGLAGGLAPRSLETPRLANERILYRPTQQPAQVLFTFPASALSEIAALDPRESVEIEIGSAGAATRVLVEVGDLAAAQAFLAAKAR